VLEPEVEKVAVPVPDRRGDAHGVLEGIERLTGARIDDWAGHRHSDLPRTERGPGTLTSGQEC
jgi:hypothetical protein